MAHGLPGLACVMCGKIGCGGALDFVVFNTETILVKIVVSVALALLVPHKTNKGLKVKETILLTRDHQWPVIGSIMSKLIKILPSD